MRCLSYGAFSILFLFVSDRSKHTAVPTSHLARDHYAHSLVTACSRAGAKSVQKQHLHTSHALQKMGNASRCLHFWPEVWPKVAETVLKKTLPGNCSILLVSVWVVDELPVQLLGLQDEAMTGAQLKPNSMISQRQ